MAHKAIKEGTSVRKEGVKMRDDSESRTVDIQVVPIKRPTSAKPHFRVLFDKAPPPVVPATATAREKKPAKAVPRELEGRVAELENELATNQEYMRSIV